MTTTLPPMSGNAPGPRVGASRLCPASSCRTPAGWWPTCGSGSSAASVLASATSLLLHVSLSLCGGRHRRPRLDAQRSRAPEGELILSSLRRPNSPIGDASTRRLPLSRPAMCPCPTSPCPVSTPARRDDAPAPAPGSDPSATGSARGRRRYRRRQGSWFRRRGGGASFFGGRPRAHASPTS